MAESSCDVDFGLVLSMKLAHLFWHAHASLRRWALLYGQAGVFAVTDRDNNICTMGFMIDDQATQHRRARCFSRHTIMMIRTHGSEQQDVYNQNEYS